MRLMQLVRYAACACTLILWASVCLARTDAPVELTWQAPRDCPQEPEVQQQLRASLGTPSGEPASPFDAHGVIEPSGDHYRLTLAIERGATHGTRVIESEDCRSLAKAATIVLALLVQKERALGRELSESEISGQPDQPRAGESASVPAPVQTAPLPAERAEVVKPLPLPAQSESPRPLHFLLRAPEARIDFVTLPRSGYGLAFGAGLAFRAWRVNADGALYQTQTTAVTGAYPYRVEFRRQSLGALGCYGWRLGPFEVAPCAALSMDRVSAHASGDNWTSQDKTALWLSIGSGVAGYLHVHRHFSLVAMGTGRFVTNRPRFYVGGFAGREQTHAVPIVTFDTSLACEWIF